MNEEEKEFTQQLKFIPGNSIKVRDSIWEIDEQHFIFMSSQNFLGQTF